jgi:hypothetical protein
MIQYGHNRLRMAIMCRLEWYTIVMTKECNNIAYKCIWIIHMHPVLAAGDIPDHVPWEQLLHQRSMHVFINVWALGTTQEHDTVLQGGIPQRLVQCNQVHVAGQGPHVALPAGYAVVEVQILQQKCTHQVITHVLPEECISMRHGLDGAAVDGHGVEDTRHVQAVLVVVVGRGGCVNHDHLAVNKVRVHKCEKHDSFPSHAVAYRDAAGVAEVVEDRCEISSHGCNDIISVWKEGQNFTE